ncbi:MAG TPA: hypothetical protein EYF95_03920 [Flavobacteriales bacterium]|nr:hypothetical protein [Flavobacteriales bacterium]
MKNEDTTTTDVELPADVTADKKKRKYDGRTVEGKKLIRSILARREARRLKDREKLWTGSHLRTNEDPNEGLLNYVKLAGHGKKKSSLNQIDFYKKKEARKKLKRAMNKKK